MTDYPNIDKLNARQRLFCERYCTLWNQAKAAREAGYSEATAKEQAVRLLTNVNVQGYIKHIKDNAADFAGVSFLRNVQKLAQIAYGSAADLRDSWDNMKDWELLSDDTKATIAEVIVTKRLSPEYDEEGNRAFATIETVKVKQYDPRLAIESLNKMLGYNAAEKITHSGGVEVTEKRMTFSDGSTRDENGNIIALPPALQPPD